LIDAIEVVPCPKLDEVKIILHTQFEDARGRIYTHYTTEAERKILLGKRFNHNKVAVSYRDVIRGIHGDNKSYKLVSCLNGEVYQVVVDCRKNVTSFGSWWSCILKGEDCQSILIPPGFGNAFLTLSESSVYCYKLSYSGEYIDANEQFTYLWNDERFSINWPIDFPILSLRDSSSK
jgi:dTDP-4-dehydrorhamnose 3,5-epimerase